MFKLKPIIADLRLGKMIILVDDQDRENEGDLICAAEFITPKQVTFMAAYGRGLVCVPLTAKRAVELELSPMASKNNTPLQHCNFTESVDARRNVKTGISAYDRATTIKTLVSPQSHAGDLSRPGHVFPLVGRDGGVLVRPGHTEGTLDLLRLAGLKNVGVLCEIMGDDGRMLSGRKLEQFAKKHALKILSIKDLIAYRRTHEPLLFLRSAPRRHVGDASHSRRALVRAVETKLPTAYGDFRAIIYTTSLDNKEHIALIKGKPTCAKPTLVRVHSECLTGDVFESLRCDCHWQLDEGLRRIAKEGEGVLVYMRHEGRGIGLVNKLKAYNLQDEGLDTVQANEKLGFKPDLREYGIGSLILADLGISKIRLMTNNPDKIAGLDAYGLKIVERIPLEITPRDGRDRRYLKTKKTKLGHLLSKV